jgi:ethanolamine ammonia-lyase small subunit
MSDWVPRPATRSLRTLTPARVALGSTGVSQHTRDLLDFQRDHALARDAVHARLEIAGMAANLRDFAQVVLLNSMAADRKIYLQRPDLGRRLDERSRLLLSELPRRPWELVLVVADGLSALAAERHAVPVIRQLLPRLQGWLLAPICLVEQGRVALGDEIGDALGVQLAVMLIGERPGLSAPDSLGAYITRQPRPGRTDAERNCISNIRAEGMTYERAAVQLAFYLTEARRRRLTGVALKEEPLRLEGE